MEQGTQIRHFTKVNYDDGTFDIKEHKCEVVRITTEEDDKPGRVITICGEMAYPDEVKDIANKNQNRRYW